MAKVGAVEIQRKRSRLASRFASRREALRAVARLPGWSVSTMSREGRHKQGTVTCGKCRPGLGVVRKQRDASLAVWELMDYQCPGVPEQRRLPRSAN